MPKEKSKPRVQRAPKKKQTKKTPPRKGAVRAEDVAAGPEAAIACFAMFGHLWSNFLYSKQDQILTIGIKGKGVQICRLKPESLYMVIMMSKMALSEGEGTIRYNPEKYTLGLRVSHVKQVDILKAGGKCLAHIDYNDETNSIERTEVFINPDEVDRFVKLLRDANINVRV